MANTEADEQRMVVARLRASGVAVFAPVNGASLRGGARQWSNLASMGADKGVPDLVIVRSDYVLFVEMKRDILHKDFVRGPATCCPCMSAAQVRWRERLLSDTSHYYILAHGYDDAVRQLKNYGVLP